MPQLVTLAYSYKKVVQWTKLCKFSSVWSPIIMLMFERLSIIPKIMLA